MSELKMKTVFVTFALDRDTTALTSFRERNSQCSVDGNAKRNISSDNEAKAIRAIAHEILE